MRTYQYGERLVDRMDFEELALKGIDPSLGPTITHPDISGKDGEKMGKEEDVNKLSGSKRTTVSALLILLFRVHCSRTALIVTAPIAFATF